MAVSGHQTKKLGSAGLDKLRTTIPRHHQTQRRFLSFSCCFPILCPFGVVVCGCHLAKWLLLAIPAHHDLLWIA